VPTAVDHLRARNRLTRLVGDGLAAISEREIQASPLVMPAKLRRLDDARLKTTRFDEVTQTAASISQQGLMTPADLGFAWR
jgi:hypothetical protein